ncbi:MAG: peptidase C39 family protein [Nanoarchaeota archaeon]|nr:peptidase C39 family protein [Nanoarchaeota archaeon]
MMLDVPFYENDGDGNQCLQVAGKCIIKYFLGKEYSLEDLDKLTGRKRNHWTYTPQIASVLYDVGLRIKFYSKEDLEPFLDGEKFYREHYGKDADKILEFTDIQVVTKSIEKLLDYNIFEKKKISISSLEKYIESGSVPLVLIDNNKIVGREDSYRGHAVVITGFDDKHIYYHDSGPSNPTPNKKVDKKLFVNAMNANGTDNDCIVVSGKR